MDIKATAESLVKKITDNSDLLAKFKANPKETVKGLIPDLKLDDGQLSNIVDLVKAKVNIDGVKSALGSIGGLFGKK